MFLGCSLIASCSILLILLSSLIRHNSPLLYLNQKHWNLSPIIPYYYLSLYSLNHLSLYSLIPKPSQTFSNIFFYSLFRTYIPYSSQIFIQIKKKKKKINDTSTHFRHRLRSNIVTLVSLQFVPHSLAYLCSW